MIQIVHEQVVVYQVISVYCVETSSDSIFCCKNGHY